MLGNKQSKHVCVPRTHPHLYREGLGRIMCPTIHHIQVRHLHQMQWNHRQKRNSTPHLNRSKGSLSISSIKVLQDSFRGSPVTLLRGLAHYTLADHHSECVWRLISINSPSHGIFWFCTFRVCTPSIICSIANSASESVGKRDCSDWLFSFAKWKVHKEMANSTGHPHDTI